MVVLTKIRPTKNDKNGVGVSKVTSTSNSDHWAFLDEIEAPMWVDLSLESKLIIEDNDDAWFHTSHPFHYHSARHLRSKFAHLNVGSDPFNFNLKGQFSPPLLSSVSKSRGKDYQIRESRSNHHHFSLDKEHPINKLGGKISSYQAQGSNENKSELSSCVTSVDGRERSTITSVSWQCDSKVLGMPKDTFGQTGILLNCLRTNLRQSRALRPALRVEIRDGKESKGHKSSEGKSSVGSSSTGNDTKCKGFSIVSKANHSKNEKVEANGSINSKESKTLLMRANLGISKNKSEVKKMGAHLKEVNSKRLDIRDFRKMAKPINSSVNAKKISEACVSMRKDCCSKVEGEDYGAPPRGQEYSKGKVLLPTMEKNSLTRPRIIQGVKSKVGIYQSSKMENIRGRAVMNYKVGGKENLPIAKVSDHKPLKLKSKVKVEGNSIGSKVT